jgi:N-acetylglutamate synthase/N-acetylornithine aminotransferase
VLVSKWILEETGGQMVGGLVVNSGCANAVLAEEELEIEVGLGLGGGFEARDYTCDFSYDYVRHSIHVEVCL